MPRVPSTPFNPVTGILPNLGHPAVAAVPSSLTVNQGQITATVPVEANPTGGGISETTAQTEPLFTSRDFCTGKPTAHSGGRPR